MRSNTPSRLSSKFLPLTVTTTLLFLGLLMPILIPKLTYAQNEGNQPIIVSQEENLSQSIEGSKQSLTNTWGVSFEQSRYPLSSTQKYENDDLNALISERRKTRPQLRSIAATNIAQVNGMTYDTLQEAIDAANAGDTIRVQDTVLTDIEARDDLTQTAIITKSLTIEGGYDSGFTAADPDSPTILDAGYNGRVFVISGTISVTLTNLMITGGDTFLAGGGSNGGGMLIQGSDVVLNNVTCTDNYADIAEGNGGCVSVGSTLTINAGTVISGNFAILGGGIFISSTGIYSSGVHLNAGQIITNTAFAAGGGVFVNDSNSVYTQTSGLLGSNYADVDGGGILIFEGSGIFQGGSIEENTAAEFGGGLLLDSPALISIADTDFLSNTAIADDGGGIFSADSVVVSGGLFQGNQAEFGGGIAALNSVTVNGTQFISNTATNLGGGIITSDATLNAGQFQNNVSGDDGGGILATNIITVIDTQFISNTSGFDGGGVATTEAMITGALFQDNYALNSGGGLYANGGGVIENSQFISNTSQDDGGGVQADFDLIVSDSLFQENRSLDIDGDGGGIDVQGALTLIRTTLISNTAGDDGGGAYALDFANVIDSLLQGNQAGDFGGGLISRGETDFTLIESSQFISNTATNNGGGLLSSGAAFVTESTFRGNTSATRGGGISFETTFDLERSFLKDNQAPIGGGVFFSSTTDIDHSHIINNIFAHNGADIGGAIAISSTLNTVEIVHNTIVSQTTSTEEAIYLNDTTAEILNTIISNYNTGITNVASTASEDYNLIHGATTALAGTFTSGGNTQIGVEPDFVDAANDDYHLNKSSPAIDTGNFDNITIDYDGSVRPQGAEVDIGAFEAASSNLILEKSATATVNAGETITYTLTVQNTGAEDADNVTVTDTLPLSVTFSQAIAHTGGTCGETSGVVICTVDTLTSAQSISFTLVVTADIGIPSGTSLENVAIVDSDLPEANTTDNSDNADTTVLANAELSLTKSAPITVTAGLQLTYTVVVTNAGPSLAPSVQIVDGLPTGVTLDSTTVTRSGSGSSFCAGVVCNISDMAVNEVVTATLVGTVDPAVTDANIINTATVFGLMSYDLDSSNDSDSATTMIETLADVSSVKVDLRDPVGPTEGLVYEIVVTNDGPSDAQAVEFADYLDTNVTFGAVSPGCIQTFSHIVECDVGTLAAGESQDYLLAVTVGDVPSGTILTNIIELGTGTPDPDITNDTNTPVTTTVQTETGPTADLNLTKTQTAPAGTVTAGEEVTYTLVVSNTGPQTANDVRLLELIPNGTTLISMTAENLNDDSFCSLGGSCELGSIGAGDTASVTVVLQVDSDYSASTLINQAYVAASESDPMTANNIASTTTNITTSASLTIEKVDLIDPVIAGETIPYQIRVINSGPSDAANVVISDTMTANVSFAGASAICSEVAGLITCNVGRLAAGEEYSVLIEVRTDDDIADGSSIANTAEVTADNATSDFDTVNTQVNQAVLNPTDLEISKSDSPDPVVAGESLTYTLVITNSGPAIATNVRVVDALPNGVSPQSVTASQGLCSSLGICDLGDVAVGATATVTLVVTVDSDQTTSITNNARVSASNPDSDESNNEASITTAVTVDDALGISKVGPASVSPNGAIAYQIVISNTGPSDATDVVLADTLPTEVTNAIASASSGSCSITGGVLTCNLDSIPAGGQVFVAINGYVDGSASGSFSNTASVTSAADGTGVSDSTTATVGEVADLALNKSATATVAAGSDITYTLSVINNGPSDAANVQITDTLPSEVTISSLGAGCLDNGDGTVTCTTATLTAGASASFQIVVTVDSDVEGGTSIENTALVTSDTADDDLGNNSDDTDTTVLGGDADLELSKSAPPTVVAGEQVTYTIVVTNSGPSPAQDVEVLDDLPSGVTLDSATITRSGSGNVLCGGSNCNVGDMAANEIVTIILVGTVDASATGTLSNEATVFSSSNDPDSTNNSDNATTTITTSADLSVSKTDLRDPVSATDGLTYEVVVTNNGPSDAQVVVLTDSLDANVTFTGASPTCSETAGVINCTIDTLAAGESQDYLIAVTVGDVVSGTQLTNNVEVSSSTTDPVAGNDTDNITTTVEEGVSESADLSLTKTQTAPVGTVTAGEEVTYTLAIANAGAQSASNVRLLELIPNGTTLISMTAENPSDNPFCSLGGSCELGSIAAGEGATVTVVLQVDSDYSASTLINQAYVAGDESDPMTANNIASTTTNITTSASLTIEKVDLIDPVIAGETIPYQIRVINSGPSDAVNVVISDSLPALTSFAGASDVCSEAAGLMTCNVGRLAAGEEYSVLIEVRTDDDITDGSSIANTAEVTADNASSDFDTVNTQVNQAVLNPTDLEISKSDSPDPVVAGESLTYTLVITNSGPAIATNVRVVDALPNGVTPQSVTASQGLCSLLGICDLGDVAVGATATVTLVVTVDSDQTTSITNNARVSASNPDSDDSNNEASTTTAVTVDDALGISKVGPASVSPNGAIAYQIVISNTGPSDATDVVLADTLPTEVTNAIASASSGSCSIAGGVLSCNLDTIAAGGQIFVAINGYVSGSASGSFTNSATVTSTADGTGVSDSTTATVGEVADLALNKSATATVDAGSDITYTLTVINNGPSDAANVRVTDTLPSEVTISSLGAGCLDNGDGTVTCTSASLASGASTSFEIVVTVDNDVAAGTSIENTAVVASDTLDDDLANNSDDADTTILGDAVLAISKSGPATVTAGESVTYTIEVINNGPSVAQNGSIQDNLPAGLTLQRVTITRSGSGPTACGGILCQLGDIAVNETVIMTIVALVDSEQTGTLANSATALSDSSTPVTSNVVTTTVESSADLSVTKTDLRDPVEANGGLTYEIVVSNDGPSDAQSVTLTDTLDGNVTFAGASPMCSETSGVVSCTIDTLASGDSQDFLIAVTVGNVVSGTVLSNNVEVRSATSDPDSSDNTDSITTTVQDASAANTDLSLTKTQTAPAGTVTAGEDVTYDLLVTNNGPLPATNVLLLDLVPSGSSIVSMSADNPNDSSAFCSLSGVCNLGTMPNSGTATVTVVLEVDSDYDQSTLINQAYVSAAENDPFTGDNIASATTDITTSASLSITKVDLIDPVMAGQTIPYQIRISNDGPSDATDVMISDNLPANTSFAGASDLCLENNGTITCNIGDLAAGDTLATFVQLLVPNDVISGTLISNTAVVSASNASDASATASTTIYQSALNPTDVMIGVSGTPDTVVAGELVTYTLLVTNNGPTTATNVQVVNALPTGVSLAEVTSSQGLCNSGVTCDLGDLAVGASATITIIGEVDSAQTLALVNTARVSASNPDSDSSNNEASVGTAVSTADNLSISKAAPATVSPNQAIAYQIVVSNDGPSDASSVELVDPLPSGLNNLIASSSQGSCSWQDSTLTCDLETITSGESALIVINGYVSGSTSGIITNVATASSHFNPTGVSDSASTTVGSLTDLVLLKSADATVIAGEAITYDLTVINNGPSDATNVVISDILPFGVTFESASDGCAVDDLTVICTQALLAAGEESSFTIVVMTENDIEHGTSLKNIAIVESDTEETNSANNTDDADTNIITHADLVLTKSGDATAIAGEQVVHTLVVVNNGPSVARAVTIQDNLPSALSFESVIFEGAATLSCNSWLCQVGDMNVDETITMTLISRIDPSVVGQVTNNAMAFSNTTDPNDDNNVDTHTIEVSTLADLSITKVDLSDPVAPTASLLYQLTVSNDGPSDARNVTITDTLGDNLTFASASEGCQLDEEDEGVIICTIERLAPGDTQGYLIGVSVGDVANGTIVSNEAEVSSETSDPDDSNNSDDEETTVQENLTGSADLSLSKETESITAYAGELVTYTLTVSNSGPATATNAQLLDMIPAGSTLISATPDNPASDAEFCSADADCYLGTIFSDTIATVTVVLQINSDFDGSSLSNSAGVSADQPDYEPTNNIANATINVTQEAELALAMTVNTLSVSTGDNLTFELTVTNNGPSDATSVVLVNTIPTSFINLNHQASQGTCTNDTCQLGTIPAGSSVSIVIEAEVGTSIADAFTVSAQVESQTFDPILENNSAELTFSVRQWHIYLPIIRTAGWKLMLPIIMTE